MNKAQTTGLQLELQRYVVSRLRAAREWALTAITDIQGNDRIDACDSIRLAIDDLQDALNHIRATMPKEA